MIEPTSIASLDQLVALQTEKIYADKDPQKPYVGLEHIAQGEPVLIGTAQSDSSVSINSVFQKNDILFGKLRPNLQKSIIAPFNGYCSTDILVLRSIEGVIPNFAGHIFQWKRVFATAVATAEGTKMPRTSWDHLRHFKVFKPERVSEQLRIAFVLDTINDAIAQTEAVIAKLKKVRAGLLHDLLRYGLDEQDRLRDPVASPEQFKDSPVGRIPKGWACGVLADIAFANPPAPLNGFNPDTSVSFIPMVDVDEEGNWTCQQTRRLVDCGNGYTPFAEGDVLFAKITPCMENGKGCHATNLCNGIGFGSTEFHVLRAKTDSSARFVFHWSMTDRLRKRALAYMSGSAGQQRVDSSFFSHFIIPIPPKEEQTSISKIIDAADDQVNAHRGEAVKLRQIKSGLMDDLLTGRVRVPESVMKMVTGS